MSSKKPDIRLYCAHSRQLQEVKDFHRIRLQCQDARLEQFLDYIKNRQGKNAPRFDSAALRQTLGELNNLSHRKSQA
jgi:hypothetical protein